MEKITNYKKIEKYKNYLLFVMVVTKNSKLIFFNTYQNFTLLNQVLVFDLYQNDHTKLSSAF